MTPFSYYGLSFNPFDKQSVREKDCFVSTDFKEMTAGLDDSEVAQYISHKVICAGGAGAILDSAALSAAHSHSSGNPRLIDNLMTDALTLGSQMDKKTIDADVILAAVAGQNLM